MSLTNLMLMLKSSIGNLIAKIVKYPHSRDFRLALKMFEEEKRIEMVLWAVWLKSNHMKTYDYFMKNWDKIVEPRGANNHESMY